MCNLPKTESLRVLTNKCIYGICDELFEHFLVSFLLRGGGGEGRGELRVGFEGCQSCGPLG